MARDPSTRDPAISPAEWGLAGYFDPDRPVRAAPAIWELEVASQVVPLARTRTPLAGAAALPRVAPTAEFLAAGRCHFVIDHDGIRHRLEVDPGWDAAPLVILLPPHADALRVAACDAARRLFARLGAREVAEALRPSALQRRRLFLLLQVLDASLAGASLREIGTVIVYPWMAGTGALAWRSSSERRRVQRLIAGARRLADRGYRDLLRP